MFCQGCGTEFAQGATFCTQCGRPKPGSAAVSREGVPQYAPAQQQYQAVQTQETSGLAIGAFVAALFIPILGLILGYVARSDIRSSNPPKGGDGMATAAIVIGWIFSVIGGIFLVFILAFWGDFMTGFEQGYYGY
jgi:Domain of unknown function (DUF4190)